MIELLRGVTAFLVAPVLIFLVSVLGSQQTIGIRNALWICFGLAVLGFLAGDSCTSAADRTWWPRTSRNGKGIRISRPGRRRRCSTAGGTGGRIRRMGHRPVRTWPPGPSRRIAIGAAAGKANSRRRSVASEHFLGRPDGPSLQGDEPEQRPDQRVEHTGDDRKAQPHQWIQRTYGHAITRTVQGADDLVRDVLRAAHRRWWLALPAEIVAADP